MTEEEMRQSKILRDPHRAYQISLKSEHEQGLHQTKSHFMCLECHPVNVTL